MEVVTETRTESSMGSKPQRSLNAGAELLDRQLEGLGLQLQVAALVALGPGFT